MKRSMKVAVISYVVVEMDTEKETERDMCKKVEQKFRNLLKLKFDSVVVGVDGYKEIE